MGEAASLAPAVASEWIAHLEATGFRANTRRSYGAALGDYLKFLLLSDCPYDRIDFRHIDRWLLRLRQRLQPRTINVYISALRGFYTFLHRRGYVTENLFREIRMVKAPRLLPKPLTEPQIAAIIAAAETPLDRALIETLYATGARVGEMVSMDLGGLDLDGATVRVIGKGEVEKVLLLTRPAVEALRVYLAWRGTRARDSLAPDRPLWTGKQRGRMDRKTMRAHLRACATRAGITERIWPHRVRHSYGTHLLDHGAELREVQELMGHASITTTQIYTQVSRVRMRAIHTRAHPRA